MSKEDEIKENIIPDAKKEDEEKNESQEIAGLTVFPDSPVSAAPYVAAGDADFPPRNVFSVFEMAAPRFAENGADGVTGAPAGGEFQTPESPAAEPFATPDTSGPADAVNPFRASELDDEGVVSTFEQAVRKIVILEDRLKRKDAELADTQKQVESVLLENRDAIEAREKAEDALRALESELAGAAEKARRFESEVEKADRTIKHEHEKRRLHLLHVRDLKHAITERDARIKQLEENIRQLKASGSVVEASDSSAAAEEIKKLQSDIFYKEIEIEKINSQLLSAQGEILSLKTRNDELISENGSLKLELEYRDNTIAELNGTVFSLESEFKSMAAKYSALSQLDIGPEDIEKLRLASEMKEFLESELDGIRPSGEDAEGESGASVRPSGTEEEAGPGDEEGAVSTYEQAVRKIAALENKIAVLQQELERFNTKNTEPEGDEKKQLGEIDEIKEKFKSLMAERDKAIELLDKFEVEAKLKERELNELKTKHAAVSADKDAAEASLKEKEIELQGIYSAFSSYKEESGFMSRENKMLKEERESLVAEATKLRQSLKELEESVTEKEAEIVRIAAESEEKIKAALEECESKIAAVNSERDEIVARLRAECDEETAARRAEAEKCRTELEEFKSEVAAIEARYQSALSDYHGLKLNVEGLLAGITETLERDLGVPAADEGGAVENTLRVISCLPEDKTAETAALFESFAANCELAIAVSEYASLDGVAEPVKPVVCVILIGGEKELLKVAEIRPAVLAPVVLYSIEPVPVQKITELVSRGVIEDYIDASSSPADVDRVMVRAVEERLARLCRVNIKKDGDEIKLRESVALTIDNKVKAGRIEALSERIDYLKDANRRMRAGINEIQGLFDQIISRITALSLQEIPPNISEGFNEITSILLRITSIKL